MCWVFKGNKKPQLLTAEEDIKVIKLIDTGNKSVYYNHVYEKDVIQPEVGIIIVEIPSEQTYMVNDSEQTYMVNDGYHSYLPDEVNIRLVCGDNVYPPPRIKITSKNPSLTPLDVLCSALVVREFIIPKGTKYLVNNYGEVVSETIKMI